MVNKEYIWIDGKRVYICDRCKHKKDMTYNLENCVCADCGSDNGYNKYVVGILIHGNKDVANKINSFNISNYCNIDNYLYTRNNNMRDKNVR